MNIKVNKSVLLKALSHGQSIVEKKTTIPVLAHILFDAEAPNKLKLTSTDMDIVLEETVQCDVLEAGKKTVSAQYVFEIIRKFPDNCDITLSFDDKTQQLFIKANKSQCKLSCLPADHFPQITQTPLDHHFDIEAPIFKKLIDQTRFAMANEDTRYFLNGLFMHRAEKNGMPFLRLVGTDAHRLAYAQVSLPEGANDIPGVIIAKKTISELRKLLDGEEGMLHIGLSKDRIEFKLSSSMLSSRLVEGNFPDYEAAIPLGHDKVMIVNVKEFSQAVDRVGTPLMNEKVRVIRLQAKRNSVQLTSLSQDVGSAEEDMTVDYPMDEAVDVGFNPGYLLDIMQQIPDEEAKVHFLNNQVATLIEAIHDKTSLYVLMPIRV
jgi:DNA polymerase-3 subunit beta